MSGFKQMMMKDMSLAKEALYNFYDTVSDEVLRINKQKGADDSFKKVSISSIVVSDCAVIFVDNGNVKDDITRDLQLILTLIHQINRSLINPQKKVSPIMTTCAIAYGDFKYVNKGANIDTHNTLFYGQAYLKAFSGSEKLRKKPGYCMILGKPDNLKNTPPFNLLKTIDNHCYYYWMLNSHEDVEKFQEEYTEISQERYKRTANILSKFTA